jgi:hypothetical protein
MHLEWLLTPALVNMMVNVAVIAVYIAPRRNLANEQMHRRKARHSITPNRLVGWTAIRTNLTRYPMGPIEYVEYAE